MDGIEAIIAASACAPPPARLGERLADKIAEFGGSWSFIIAFFCVMAVWIAANSVQFLWRPWDPYPFILFNLILSMLAAIQAPIIMMSQNRKEVRDRARAELDLQVDIWTGHHIAAIERQIAVIAADLCRLLAVAGFSDLGDGIVDGTGQDGIQKV